MGFEIKNGGQLYKRGQIYIADLTDVKGSEQGGYRPVLIIQNDIGNKYSPTVIVACITSRVKNNMPTHAMLINEFREGLDKDSVILLEQIRTLDKRRLRKYIGTISNSEMDKVNEALKISVGLREEIKLTESQKEELKHVRAELERIDNIICWWIDDRGGDILSIPTEMMEFNMRYKEYNYLINKYRIDNKYEIKYEKVLARGEEKDLDRMVG